MEPGQAPAFYQRLKPARMPRTIPYCPPTLPPPMTCPAPDPRQLALFESIRQASRRAPQRQFCRRAGLAREPLRLGASWLHAVAATRPGARSPNAQPAQPVMTLGPAVIFLRDVAAGESVGYGAIWFRRAALAHSHRLHRLWRRLSAHGARRHARAGERTARRPGRSRFMDMITVDVTDLPGVGIGDEVVLWGDGLPVGEVARHVGTIGYERAPACRRAPRVVVVA